MEDALDEIARGEAERVPWLRRFYFGAGGNGAGAAGDGGGHDGPEPGSQQQGAAEGSPRSGRNKGLKALVTNIGDIDARDVSSFPLAGTDIVVRVGRYGPYLERDGQRANVPEDMAPDELTPERAEELLDQPSGDKPLGTDPDSGHVLVAKAGRFGPYVTEQLEEGSKDKPRTASLLKSMTLDTVTLDDALRLLSLPRTLGEIDGEPVTVQNGRYGPYVKHGSESRSLATEEEMFTISLEEAKGLLAQPKPRGRRTGAAAPPLRDLQSADPASGKPMVIKDGRFGPYVTDGEINASLRKGDDVTTITVQRAAELLAERRAAAPAPRAKRAAAKATTAKSTAKPASTAAKKTAAKKPAAARKKSET
jgi:DNA topoisomerase-1